MPKSLKIGYIRDNGKDAGGDRFEFREAPYRRLIGNGSDRIKTPLLKGTVDYADARDNAEWMRNNAHVILVNEPFLLDDRLKKKSVNWVYRANAAEECDIDPFAGLDAFKTAEGAAPAPPRGDQSPRLPILPAKNAGR